MTLGSIKKHIPLNQSPSAGHEIPGTDEEIVHPAVVEAQPPAVILVYLQQRQTARMSLTHLFLIRLAQQDVYNRLKNSGILYGYIVPSYDVLHTFSKEYPMEDLISYMKEKGVLES